MKSSEISLEQFQNRHLEYFIMVLVFIFEKNLKVMIS